VKRGAIVNRIVLVGILALVLAGSSAWAIHDAHIGGYSGQTARIRRENDPYSRQLYFGEGYTKPFYNFGSKGPTYRFTNTGAKSAYSGVFQLDTSEYRPQGRNPRRISNWDPKMRGFDTVDEVVTLLPYYPVEISFGNLYTQARATARVVSRGNAYGSTLNDPYPRTQFFIATKNMPPVGDGEIYEAWLYDKETEYAITLGFIKIGPDLTGDLFFEIRRKVKPYDSIMITREPWPDIDPSPHEIVLMGDIPTTRSVLGPNTASLQRVR